MAGHRKDTDQSEGISLDFLPKWLRDMIDLNNESAGREFVSHKGYEVCAVFKDEGVSGNVIDRPGLQCMLKFLRAHRNDNLTVIIDNPARLARGVDALISLHTEIANVGALIETYSGDETNAA